MTAGPRSGEIVKGGSGGSCPEATAAHVAVVAAETAAEQCLRRGAERCNDFKRTRELILPRWASVGQKVAFLWARPVRVVVVGGGATRAGS